MKFQIALTLALMTTTSAFAAGVPSNCTVSAGSQVIGTFSVKIGEEMSATQTYAIPGTDKVANARVFFTDELVRIKWNDKLNAYADQSTTIRLDITNASAPIKAGIPLEAKDSKNVTRLILADDANVPPSAIDYCKNLATDANALTNATAVAAEQAILKDSCSAYIQNNQSNHISASEKTGDQIVTLECKDQ